MLSAINPFLGIASSELGEAIEVLIVLFFWTIPAQLLIGFLPQESMLLYAAQYYPAGTVTGVVTGALLIAEVLNYHMINAIGRMPWIQSLLGREAFRSAVQLFNRAPFAAIVVSALTPIPFLPIRFLAPLSGYPLAKYIGAIACGRLPRIYLIALLGYSWTFPVWLLVLLTLVPLLIILRNLKVELQRSGAQSINVLWVKVRSLITVPNVLTLLRLLVLLPCIVYAMAYDFRMSAFIGVVLLGVTDMLDGYIARHFDAVTQLGKYFDYAVDIFCLFVTGFTLSVTTDLPVQFVYFHIVRESIHISSAAYLAGRGITTKSSRFATISGFFIITLYSMYILALPLRDLFLVATIISMLTGTVHYGRLYLGSVKPVKRDEM
jgi:cardiolipin synthase (CMP-forming)